MKASNVDAEIYCIDADGTQMHTVQYYIYRTYYYMVEGVVDLIETGASFIEESYESL